MVSSTSSPHEHRFHPNLVLFHWHLDDDDFGAPYTLGRCPQISVIPAASEKTVVQISAMGTAQNPFVYTRTSVLPPQLCTAPGLPRSLVPASRFGIRLVSQSLKTGAIPTMMNLQLHFDIYVFFLRHQLHGHKIATGRI